MTAPSSGKKSGFKAFLGRHEFLSSVLKVISGTGVAQLVAIIAVLIVTHDLGVARLLSHRIIVMKGGQVIETGLTDQVLDDPREPYTQLLVASILPT